MLGQPLNGRHQQRVQHLPSYERMASPNSKPYISYPPPLTLAVPLALVATLPLIMALPLGPMGTAQGRMPGAPRQWEATAEQLCAT